MVPKLCTCEKLRAFRYDWSIKVYVGGEAALYAPVGIRLLENSWAILRCFRIYPKSNGTEVATKGFYAVMTFRKSILTSVWRMDWMFLDWIGLQGMD